MSKRQIKKVQPYRSILVLGIAVLLAACGGAGVRDQTPATAPTSVSSITPTTAPSPSPSLIYLIRADGVTNKLADRVEQSIRSLSESAGYEFAILADLPDGEIDPRTLVFFSLPPAPGIGDLAVRNPKVHFVAIGIPDLNEATNLTRIGPEGLRADQVGFIAGVLAAAVTPDWRAGAVSLQNSGDESASNTAFQNGVKFYCGLCRPSYPPFHSYPLGVETSSLETPFVENAMAVLTNLEVDTIFLSPDISAAASGEMLAGVNAEYIGGESPTEIIGQKWIATVRAAPELAIVEIWERVRIGENGGPVPMPIILEDVNRERLTPGREAWVLEILQDLIDGFIDTGLDPSTGNVP